MNAKPLPSLGYLRECFELDETCPSGLCWRLRPPHHFPTHKGWSCNKSRDAHKAAGALCGADGGSRFYYRVGIAGSVYGCHRIVYAMFHGIELPLGVEIGHKNNDGTDNRISNLRLASSNQNRSNVNTKRNNTSTIKGVMWHKQGGYWYGLVTCDGKRYRINGSQSKEAVGVLVSELREKLHREFTNHG